MGAWCAAWRPAPRDVFAAPAPAPHYLSKPESTNWRLGTIKVFVARPHRHLFCRGGLSAKPTLADSGPRWGSHHGGAAVSATHSHSPVQDQSRDRASTRYDLPLVQAGEPNKVQTSFGNAWMLPL